MEKIGVFLSRMQPIHNAHLWMIENALKENDRILVMIGSANKKGTERNPFDIKLRREIVESAIKEKFLNEYETRIKVIELPDWSSEKNNDDVEWGRLIYYTVVSNMDVKEFSYYCAEKPEMIKGWFEHELRERINFRFFSRNNQFNGLSATKIREAILKEDYKYIEQYCPTSVIKNIQLLKETMKQIK